MKKGSGILLHISSLPDPNGREGIGTMGAGAYKFIDFLEKAKQSYWQVLPMGPTGINNSPYEPETAFGGNPLFIDLEFLVNDGLLEEKDLDVLTNEYDYVDYTKVIDYKFKLLKKACSIGYNKFENEIKIFKSENSFWINEYAEFKKDVEFTYFTQYLFFKQWTKLKAYANKKGIKIIGDIPFYVPFNSSDFKYKPELFKLDVVGKPIGVSGVPPDAFSDKGQLWNTPVYDFTYQEEDGFSWWIKRIEYLLKQFDIVRIDHFRAFEAYWEVPFGSKTAIDGKWVKVSGYKFVDILKDKFPQDKIIVEDLGIITSEVKALKEYSTYFGMAILQFAFDSDEYNTHHPKNITENTVAYSGSHDNKTIIEWLYSEPSHKIDWAKSFLQIKDDMEFNWGFLKGVWDSKAFIAIAPIQDFLGLGADARMNTPSVVEGCWRYRVKPSELTDFLAKKIRILTINAHR